MPVFPPYPWQDAVWQHLLRLNDRQRLPHALLLSGSAGWGKLALAQSLARYLLCQAKKATEPCGQCKDCQLSASEDGHPDLFSIEPDGKLFMIKVEAIREVVSVMTQTALTGGYRLIIINQAQCMNLAAANCLLKTLEEPGRQSLLILVSDSPNLLLPTIRSRCQQVQCHSHLNPETEAWLQPYLNGSAFSYETLWQISNAAPLQVKALLESEQLPFADKLLQQLLESFDALTLAADCVKHSFSASLIWLIHLSNDCIRLLSQVPERLIFQQYQRQLEQRCQAITLTEVFAYLQKCYHYRDILNRKVSINETLALEDLLLSWQKLYLHKSQT